MWGAANLAALALGIPLAFVNPRTLAWAYLSALALIPLALLGFEYVNPNVLGAYLAIGVAVSLAYEFLIPITLSLVAATAWTQSRTAIAAMAAVLFAYFWRISRIVAIALAFLSLLGIWSLSGGRGEALIQRVGIWQDTTFHLSAFGAGFGAFYKNYDLFEIHTNATLVRFLHVYNDYLELVYLLGIGTIPLWFFVAGVLPATNLEARIVLLCFGVLSLSFFPLFMFPINTLVVATLVRAAVSLPSARWRSLYA